MLNLRSPHEQGFLNDEQQHAKDAGLNYANVPLNPSESNQELVEKAIWEIENLPSPVLVRCAAGAFFNSDRFKVIFEKEITS
ncbi:MAG: hypothetical protein KME22_19860 [Hassallia sp. WJT32-NPBG1]|nr:hypothetical protein [Hassallia sp. WJT32-NPBG1]